MSKAFEMISDKGELSIYPGDDSDPIVLNPYMRTGGIGWLIDDSKHINYTPDTVRIDQPTIGVNLVADMVTYIDGSITKPENVVAAHLKPGLVIDGPGSKTIDLSPYINRVDLTLNPQTINVGERDIFVRAKHMFLISVTFKPYKLTVFGNKTYLNMAV